MHLLVPKLNLGTRRTSTTSEREHEGTWQMKVNCLACGHSVDLDDDYGDYTGLVKCFVCSALLEIRTEEGRVKAVHFVKIVRGIPESSEALDASQTMEAGARY
jgi:transcription elongation factor Elf1